MNIKNLFNPQQNFNDLSTKQLEKQGFLQPYLMPKESTYELLKLLKISMDNIKRILKMNLELFSPKSKQQQQSYIIISNLYDEFQLCEKLIFNYMSMEQTWVLQKVPIIVFQYIDYILCQFQIRISSTVSLARDNLKMDEEQKRKHLKKEKDIIKKGNDEANRHRKRTTNVTFQLP